MEAVNKIALSFHPRRVFFDTRWFRRVREAVLVSIPKNPNASDPNDHSADVAKQKDRGTYHARWWVEIRGGSVGFVKRSS